MPTQAPVTEVSLSATLEALRRRRRHILAPTLVLTLLAAILALILPSTYRARAHVAADPLVPQEFVQARRDGHGAPDPHAGNHTQLRRMKEVLLSRSVLETMIREFKLYPADDRVHEKHIEDMKTRVFFDAEADGELYVGFIGASRREAMDVANRLAQTLVEQTSVARDQQATEAGKVVSGALETLRRKLSDQEQKINQYKAQAGLARPDQMDANMRIFQSLQEQLEHKRAALGDEEAHRTAFAQEVAALERQGAARNPSREVEDLRMKVKQAQGRYTEQHPERIALERQLREIESGRAGSSGEASPTYLRYIQAKADLEGRGQRIASYRREIGSLEAQIASYEQRLHAAPQHERAMAELMRDYETTRTQYQELMGKQHEAKLGYQLDRVSSQVVFRLVEPASLPVAPASPYRGRILLMGLVAGLALGLVAAFVFEQSDSSIMSLDDLQAFTTLPTLAVVPSMQNDSSIEKTGGKPGIALLANPRSILSEQYRVLADRVREEALQSGARIIAVTSAVGGEGKTTVAINLALALSRMGDGRVLLVDADLRKPRVGEYLEIAATRGFGHVLQRPEDDVNRYTWRLRDLFVLPGAGSIPDPVGALSSERARSLFASLRKDFRFIVVDSPPVLPIADASLLSRLADRVVFVVRARRTRRELVARGVESIDTRKVVGIVLNDADVQNSRYAGAYEYYEKCYLAR
jgi:polysaccharide chain length determinant protein (PEP-CTERM system associated)